MLVTRYEKSIHLSKFAHLGNIHKIVNKDFDFKIRSDFLVIFVEAKKKKELCNKLDKPIMSSKVY